MRTRWSAVILGMVVTASAAHAHPHMWIDTVIGFRYGLDGLAGFTVTWAFDELNSASMLQMFDADGNGALSERESETARKEGFEHLYDIGYFLKLEVNGAVRRPDRASEFLASVQKGRLVYSFFVPLRLKVTSGWSSVGISVMDDSFFVDFAIPEGGVRSDPPAGLENAVRRLQKPQKSSAGWTVVLQQVELKLRTKPA